MRWHRDLYAGESVQHKQRKVKWNIIHHAGQLFVHVITLAANEKNLLDIIPAWALLQKQYHKKDLYVVGLAGNYQEALELAARIVCDVYQATGGFDIKDYFRRQGKQGT